MTMNTFPMTLKETKMVTPNVKHLGFQHALLSTLDFIPGQFITIHFKHQDKLLKRSYSIATIPGQTPLIEMAASYFPGGPGTELLFHLKPGDTVEATGPHGRLVLRDENPKRYILVATGTGITPYRSMLPELEKRMQTEHLKVVVLLGVKNREELLYGDDFLAVEKRQPNFEFHVHYSRMNDDTLLPGEQKGYVQTAFHSLSLNSQEDVVYLCGNPNMIDDAFNQLKELGFDPSHVRREKYISAPTREK